MISMVWGQDMLPRPECNSDVAPPLPSPRAAWAVVGIALVLTLAMAAWLEAFHRAEVTRSLGRPPADWTDRQLKNYAVAEAFGSLGQLGKYVSLMKAVADQEPSGDITAAAAHIVAFDFAATDRRPTEALRYGRLAAEAVSPDSDRFVLYHRTHALALHRAGELEELESVLRHGIARGRGVHERAQLLETLLRLLRRAERSDRALAVYEELTGEQPALAEEDSLRSQLAAVLCDVGREAEALEIYRDLALSGTSENLRQLAAAQLSELEAQNTHPSGTQGRGADGH